MGCSACQESDQQGSPEQRGGLHLSKEQSNWQFLGDFSFGRVMKTVQDKAPTLLRVLTAAAVAPKKPTNDSMTDTPIWDCWALLKAQTIRNQRDPFVVSKFCDTIIYLTGYIYVFQTVSIACMMLFAARNMQFVAFQQTIGLFLFANACTYAIYPILNRAGSYTTVGKLLRRLTHSTQKEVHTAGWTSVALRAWCRISHRSIGRTLIALGTEWT